MNNGLQVGVVAPTPTVIGVQGFEAPKAPGSLGRIRLNKSTTAFVRVGDTAMDLRLGGTQNGAMQEASFAQKDDDAGVMRISRDQSGRYQAVRLTSSEVSQLDADVQQAFAGSGVNLVLQSVEPLTERSFEARLGSSMDGQRWQFDPKTLQSEQHFRWEGVYKRASGEPRLGEPRRKRSRQDPKTLEPYKGYLKEQRSDLNKMVYQFAFADEQMEQRCEHKLSMLQAFKKACGEIERLEAQRAQLVEHPSMSQHEKDKKNSELELSLGEALKQKKQLQRSLGMAKLPKSVTQHVPFAEKKVKADVDALRSDLEGSISDHLEKLERLKAQEPPKARSSIFGIF